MELLLKRAYEPAEATDGYRVLVDRLWPRGLSKERAQIDEWAKELAPSTELRQWFGHAPSRWEEFARDYRAELEGSTAGREFVTRLQDEDALLSSTQLTMRRTAIPSSYATTLST